MPDVIRVLIQRYQRLMQHGRMSVIVSVVDNMDYTCECGHIKAYHNNGDTTYGPLAACRLCQDRQYASVMSRNGSNISVYYPWHEFRPDNLRHLERLACEGA